MEQYINNDELEQLIAYVKSYNLMLKLYDSNIDFEEQELTMCFKYTLTLHNREIPIQKINLYLYKSLDYFLIDIRFKNIVFNGHKMRKKLLKYQISNYTKSKNSYGQHCYDIRFSTLVEFQNILECFNDYLPK